MAHSATAIKAPVIPISRESALELSLRMSELRYRRLFEAAQDGILILNAETGSICDVNPYLLEMLGYTREEFVGKKLWEVGSFRDVEASRNSFLALQKAKFIRYDDLPLKTKAGRLVQVEFVSSVYQVGEEKVIQCNIRDISDRKRVEAAVRANEEAHWSHVTALAEIDRAISSSFDLDLSLATLLTHVMVQLRVDAADVLLYNRASHALEYCVGRGFRTKAIEQARLPLAKESAAAAGSAGAIIQIPDLTKRKKSLLGGLPLKGEAFVNYFGAPLTAKGELIGILEVFQRAPVAHGAEWLDCLGTLASKAATAIENSTLFDDLQRSNTELAQAYDATIEGWSRAMELRDGVTDGHTQRVAVLAVKVGRLFGLSDAELAQVRWGALLHDIGKMGIPDAILLKKEALTEAEWAVMKKHTLYASEMLSPIRYLRLALDIPCAHHEKWDGTGYPLGLKGEQIPLVARIFAVVDVWDALRSDRSYRSVWPVTKVRKHLRSLSGSHFDPQAVKACLDSDLLVA